MTSARIADAYLDSLGLEPQAPGLGALSEIVRVHVARLPFASIGPRLGDDLPIDPPALLDRLVVRRRGGYCFEQNGLLFEVLTELGYAVRLQMARVLVSGAEHPPLTHRVTRVSLDEGEFLVDVGFGPQGPPYPLRLEHDLEPHGRYRLMPVGDHGTRLEVRTDADWAPLYRFDHVPYGQSDAVMGHFYSHRHPEAAFVNNLVASRILEHEVRSLRNREYHVIRADGTDVETLADPERLHAILTEEMGLRVTPEESARLFAECG